MPIATINHLRNQLNTASFGRINNPSHLTQLDLNGVTGRLIDLHLIDSAHSNHQLSPYKQGGTPGP